MKTKTMVVVCVLLSRLIVAGSDQCRCVKDPGHGKLLREHFDTTYWKDIWSEDTWHLCCMFVDFDEDGLEEMLAITTSEEDPMGDCWKVWKQSKGGMTQVQFCGNLFYWCHASSFYKIHSPNGATEVLGIGMEAGYMDKDCRNIVKSAPDCRFVFSESGKYHLKEIIPNLDTMFISSDSEYIERLYPEWYFGFDFKPPQDIPHNPYLELPPYAKPKGDLRIGGGIGEPPGFAAFVDRYRCAQKARTPDGVKAVSVYVVFLDADNDGNPDFYITSDVDKVEDGNFSWNLYVRRGEVFCKAKDIVYPIPSRKDFCALSPIVRASKDAFCRVVRLDVDPIFLIVDGVRKNQIRDAITNSYAHRIEKLPCRTYPDDQERNGKSPCLP